MPRKGPAPRRELMPDPIYRSVVVTQLVNKILHYPILELKEASEEPQERESLRRTIRKIFGLR